MKKIILFCLMVAFIGTAYSQELRVEGIVELTQDLTARTSPRLDKSGTECAILRINIPSIREVYFSSTIVGDPICAPGEYTVYVPANSKKIDLTCEGKHFSIVFSDFQVELQPKSCYRVVVKKLGNNASAEGYARVKITANYEDDILLIDGVPVGQLPLFLDNLTFGEHTFAVPNTVGRIQNDTIIYVTKNTTGIRLHLKDVERESVKTRIDFYGPRIEEFVITWGYDYVEHDGKMGIIDYVGDTIVPVRYDNVEFLDSMPSLGDYIIVWKDKEYNGEKKRMAGLYRVGEGEALACNYFRDVFGRGNPLYVFSTMGSYCVKFFNTHTGKFVGSGCYKNHEYNLYDGGYIKCVDEDKNAIVMDLYGREIIKLSPKSPDKLLGFNPQGKYAITERRNPNNGRQYVYDLMEEEWRGIPEEYRSYGNFFEGLFFVSDKKTKEVGLLNKNMKVVVPVIYSYDANMKSQDWLRREGTYFKNKVFFLTATKDTVLYNSNGVLLAYLKKDGGCTIYNNDGAIIAKTGSGGRNSYKTVKCFWGENNCIFLCEKGNGQTGVVDSNGAVIIPFSYDEKECYNDYICCCKVTKKDGRSQIVDFEGKILVPWGYYKHWNGYGKKFEVLTDNSFMIYKDGVCIAQIPVSQDFDFFMTGMNGIVQDKYTICFTNDERLFQIKNNETGKYGFISANGELLTSCIYEEISRYVELDSTWEDFTVKLVTSEINKWSASEGYGIIGLGGRFGYIDITGKVVVPLIYTAVTPFIDGVAWVRDQNGKWTKIYSKDLK